MARRSKKDNAVDIATLIAALILLGAFALAGGNLKRTVEFFVPLVILGIFLIVAGVMLYILFWKIGNEESYPKIPQTQTHTNPTSEISLSDSECEPIGSDRLERFTQELLDQLEWRRFEMLVQALFQAEGLIASRIRAGADGGIDLTLRESLDGPVTAIVQCKAWKTYTVGVKPVRELFGVMHAEGVPRAYFFTSGHFTSEARAFVEGKPLDLINSNKLLFRLNALEKSKRDSILADITESDYTTPTCPSCDTKMVRRVSRHGEFWGCRSYPRCKQTFHTGKQGTGDK